MVPAMEAMNTPAPPGAITSANASSIRAVPRRSTRRIASTGACIGDTPGRVGDRDDTSVRLCRVGQFLDRRLLGDVDYVADYLVPGRGQRGNLAVELSLVDIGEDDRRARADTPGDGDPQCRPYR
jgi:hypothetical protein